MKTLFLSVFDGLFSTRTKENSRKIENNLFLTYTNATTGRTLIIEEDLYSVWAYILCLTKEAIDLEGFLCSVTDPKVSEKEVHCTAINKKKRPFPVSLANRYSYVKNLQKKDIQVDWQGECVHVHVRGDLYLIMNLKTKISYSKGLAKDCLYGKVLKV